MGHWSYWTSAFGGNIGPIAHIGPILFELHLAIALAGGFGLTVLVAQNRLPR